MVASAGTSKVRLWPAGITSCPGWVRVSRTAGSAATVRFIVTDWLSRFSTVTGILPLRAARVSPPDCTTWTAETRPSTADVTDWA